MLTRTRGLTVAVALLLVPIASERSLAASDKSKNSAKVFEAPRPKYPYAARKRRLEGSGVLLINVDVETGRVRSVRMLKSTGHKLLDDSALEAFAKWRFRPRAVPSKVKVPIKFTLHKPNG